MSQCVSEFECVDVGVGGTDLLLIQLALSSNEKAMLTSESSHAHHTSPTSTFTWPQQCVVHRTSHEASVWHVASNGTGVQAAACRWRWKYGAKPTSVIAHVAVISPLLPRSYRAHISFNHNHTRVSSAAIDIDAEC